MKVWVSAHFVSRTLRGMGFEPRIVSAICVRPFNKGQKNDYNDAEAIAEAAMRPKAGADRAGGDRQDRESLGPKLHCQGLGKALHKALGR
jgi:transposase